jgi:hypothetical protein
MNMPNMKWQFASFEIIGIHIETIGLPIILVLLTGKPKHGFYSI